jgi:hypothetical protein
MKTNETKMERFEKEDSRRKNQFLEEYIFDYGALLKKILVYNDNPNFVFRGQVENYSTDKYPYSFLTSFDRTECIPSLHFKWNYYCLMAFKELIGPENYGFISQKEKLLYTEAILQHYGWRSMQLDLSSKFDVSLFFAGYQFEMIHQYQIVEDCYESGVIESVDLASYSKSNREYGYIYVFDRKLLLTKADARLVDLSNIEFENIRPYRQKGWVLSSFPKQINEITSPALVKVLIIKTDLIVKYCQEKK